MFEQNTEALTGTVKTLIIAAIKDWEPRVTILELIVENTGQNANLAGNDDRSETEHILSIRMKFAIPDNIQAVDSIVIQLPIGGGA